MRLGPAYGLPRGLLRGSESLASHWQGRPESGPTACAARRRRRWSRASSGVVTPVEGVTVRDELAEALVEGVVGLGGAG